MKNIFLVFNFFILVGFIHPKDSNPKSLIHDYIAINISGEKISLKDFKGKKILIVNVASNCGYTNQYKDLQTLQNEYKDKLQIIAFPCNDFGSQEPGSNSEIAEFCEVNYGVTFPVMSKINIREKPIHPVYEWLTNSEMNGWNDSKPRWNFYKYLIDEEGKLIKLFGSSTSPLSKEITQALKI